MGGFLILLAFALCITSLFIMVLNYFIGRFIILLYVNDFNWKMFTSDWRKRFDIFEDFDIILFFSIWPIILIIMIITDLINIIDKNIKK